MRSTVLVVGMLVICLMTPATGQARPPEIRNVNIRGLMIGGTTIVTMDGVDLLPAPRLFLGDQVIEAAVDLQSTANRLILSIPLPETIAPGIRSLRIATAEGFSNSHLIGLDRFPQSTIAEKIGALPASIHGSVPGSGVSRTTFDGKAGEEIIVEVEAKRLASKLRPVVHLYDSQRRQVSWATPSNTLAGDCRAVVRLPRDDVYSIELHDSQYAPPGPSYFRMKVGQWQFADMAFPPAVPKGHDATVAVFGNVPGLQIPVRTDDAAQVPVLMPNSPAMAGLPPTVLGSALPELVEGPEGEVTMLPGIPFGVSGRLIAPGQRDRFQLPVTPGTKVLLELYAERIGSNLDAVLEIRNKQNALLASNDDGPGSTDPRLEFTVPADTDGIELVVRDNLDVGSERSIYRLVGTASNAQPPQFDVVVKSDAINVASAERQVLEVLVSRQNYDGPIQLQIPGLPPGVVVKGNEIPAGANGTLLELSAEGDSTAQLITRLRAASPDGVIARPVHVEVPADDRTPGWMHEQVAIAATPRAASAFQIAIVNDASVSQLVLASKPVLTLKVTRPAAVFGPVRLSLVTSQLVPKVNGQPNLSQAVRAEKPVEIPVDAAVKTAGDSLGAIEKQLAEATQQALVAQGDAKVAADAKVTEIQNQKSAAETTLRDAEARAVYQIDYAAIVPSTLTDSSCDLSVRAELLNLERNTVLRTTYTPVKRLPVLNPLSIKLTASVPLETTLDPSTGAVYKLTAAVERQADYKGDVNVTIAGLPAGVAAANVAVKADQSEFAIDFRIPANFAAAEITGVKLLATGPADPLSGNIPVKSPELPVSIKINKPAQ